MSCYIPCNYPSANYADARSRNTGEIVRGLWQDRAAQIRLLMSQEFTPKLILQFWRTDHDSHTAKLCLRHKNVPTERREGRRLPDHGRSKIMM
jgi:hypothetical protein